VLDVDVHEAELVILEAALSFGGLCWRRFSAPVQSFGLEDTPDAVAIEMRQEMADDEGQVVEGEVAKPTERADNGALFVTRLPGQVVWPGGMVQAVGSAALRHLRMVSEETP